MPWFRVDDGLASKLETTRIPRTHRPAAIGLWALAGSWSARELTDGFIPEHMIDELAGTAESAAWLVSAGFWSAVDGGFQFAEWNGQQPMRAKVLEAREKNTAKVQNWRARNRVTGAVTNQGTNQEATPPPTRPDPTASDEAQEHPSPSAREIESAFDEAYSQWPKKAQRKASLQAFARAAKKRPVDQLIADVVRHGKAYAETREKQFVPALCVWLRGERWDDELPTVPAPSDEQWNAFLAGTRTEQNMRVVAPVATQETESCHHRWMPDGTCNFCPAHRDRVGVAA